jgi:hypothetical protein
MSPAAAAATAIKMPVWSKILIGLMIGSAALVFALGLTTIFGVKRLGNDMVDQKKIAAAAATIASFPDPLPAGFHYLVGLHLDGMGVSLVTIAHEPDKQLFTFSGLEGTIKSEEKDLLEYGYSAGLNMLSTTAKFTDIIKKDSVAVANSSMPYIIGHTVDISGKAGAGMVGCIRVPADHPKKNILIYSLQTTDVPYNQQITMKLLNSIKSF